MKKFLDSILWFFDVLFVTFAPFQAIDLTLKKDNGYSCAIDILSLFSIVGFLHILFRFRNSLQTFLVYLDIWVIVLMCLFPPWVRIYSLPRSNIKGFELIGYGSLWSPPPQADTIDFDRLGLQLGLLLFLGSCIVFSKYIFPKTQPKPKPAPSDEPLPKKKRKWIKNTLVFICILVVFGYGVFVTMVYLYTENQYSKLREDNSRLATQLREKGQYSSEQWTAEQERAKNATYEELMADLDSEYGAECRDEAERKFNALAAEGKVPKGKPAMATRIMERCYKEAKATQQQPSKLRKKSSRINREFLDSLEAGEQPEGQENSAGFSPQRYYNINDFDDGLQIDAYGPGIHMNRYGQPVTLRPDFGGVPGEHLQIQPDAYGPGIHMDQYGRPVREYPRP